MGIKEYGFTTLTPVDEALKTFLETLKPKPLAVEEVSSEHAFGRVLAEDVSAPVDAPGFDRSAMDGYAVRAEDTFNASPTSPALLRVVGRVETTLPPELKVGPGEAVEVSTGSPVPPGADAVVMLEYTRRVGDRLEVYRPVAAWENVDRAGMDYRRGSVVLRRGRVLRAQDVAALLMLGVAFVRVYRRPRVAVLSTGDELVESFSDLAPGRVVDVNRPMLKLLLSSLGCVPVDLGMSRDDVREVSRRISEGLEKADALLVSGGTSVGRRDVVPEALETLGADVVVHGVAMSPSRPTLLAVASGKPIIGMSGPPAAALMCFEVFAKPVLLRLMGVESYVRPYVRARLARRAPSRLGVRSYVRVRLIPNPEGLTAEPVAARGSGLLSTVTEADGFIVVPENRDGLEAGEEVEVYLFEWGCRTFG